MEPSHSVTHLIDEARQGESAAAGELWRRYCHRLAGLARTKLGEVRRVADEDDVAVQAFHSFLRGAEDGRFPELHDRDDLWQILVMLAARKACDQRRHWARQKRGADLVRGESLFQNAEQEGLAGLEGIASEEPTPEDAVAVIEKFRELWAKLADDTLRQVALGKLEGQSNEELATRLGCKTRTIERKLARIRELWAEEVV